MRNCDHFCKPSIIGREKLESKRKQKEVRGGQRKRMEESEGLKS